GTARIVRGDSLWQISRRIYGKGTRYTVIFDANQPQIRNPDLIYPGQIFVLPSDGTAAGTQDGTRG
ncbi:LysM peptidoglycan-binding domain-containing protein, partial [Methylobacterium sp. J-078]|uniref:LysM peptidoglycan-binding domain-containing protein n=1 Tax=Methylobacterium sp. J-078 TaxID=2836657 RepID=UPI001FB93F97